MSATSQITALLGLRHPPIAIGFLTEPPAGVPRWTSPAVAAGCVFWRKAMEGQTFYTVPADHYNTIARSAVTPTASHCRLHVLRNSTRPSGIWSSASI